jgi:HAE1 family hydrophobic/amphiphilic exporter-1
MSLSSRAVQRPIAVAMLFVAIILLGLVSLRRLPIDLLPDIAYPQLVVYTADPGVSPTEMERSVTESVERAVQNAPGVQRVESLSREGISLVTVRFGWGTDMDFAALNVREQLDNISDGLPVSADPPIVLRTDPRSEPILSLSVSGQTNLRALKELTEQVFKRRLEQLDGVAHAAVTGGLEREIQVDVDPRLMESYGITIEEIAQALAAANSAGAGGGTIKQGRYRYSLRTIGEFRSADEIGAVVIRLSGGAGGGAGAAGGGVAPGAAGGGGTGGLLSPNPAPATILLRDIATITDGTRERESIARFAAASEDGAETGSSQVASDAVGLLIFKNAGDNTVQVAESVEATLEEIRIEYPEVRIEVAMSQAGFISAAIANVEQSLVMGAVLAFLVLFLFLREPRYPIAIAVAIPISVVGSFSLLDAAGISLNIMTLGGLALGVGMLMDNSIIVLENIFRHREEGLGAALAAVRGTEEVNGAITASTLTTIAVFAPIVYIEGVAGELLGSLSLAVAFSLLASLVVAVILVPVLAARWGTGEDAGDRPGRLARWMKGPGGTRLKASAGRPFEIFDGAFNRYAAWQHRLLAWSLDHRGRVVGTALLLLASSLVVGSFLPRSVLPDVDEGGFRLRLELDQGTPIERTDAAARRLEEILMADEAVEATLSRIGMSGAFAGIDVEDSGLHTGLFEVQLKEGASTDDAIGRVRAALDEVAATEPEIIPGGSVTIESSGATAFGRIIGGAEADLAVRVQADDLDLALEHARRVEERLRGVTSLANVRVGMIVGQPEILVEIDRERAASFGIDPVRIANTIEGAMRGTEATRFADFDRRVPVLVRLPEQDRYSLETLDNLAIDGVPVRQLVTLHRGLGPSEVHRLDQTRLVPVFADVASGGLARALEQTEAALADLELPPRVRTEIGGENEEMRRSFHDLFFAFVLSILLVYMILAAQFESLVHPFTILLAVPLALIGALWGLALAGVGLNTMSLIGIVILVGIVDNDAIIKVDMINQLRRQGLPLREAILEGSRMRLRPIIMTTVTTVVGMLPMALGIGSGADLQAPMAIAIVAGLTVATMLTLIVVPVAYDLVEEVQQRISGRKTGSVATIPLPAAVGTREKHLAGAARGE